MARSIPTPAATESPYTVVGLDGVRAIAVLLVLLFHLTPGGAVGGFIGVDVFFVVSGFIITALLLRQSEAAGRIRLLDFWRRRARRLLPALGLLLAVCCALALAVGGDVLVGLGRQLIGAATFTSNWLSVADGEDYFTSFAPPLLRNLWSLAVEEQFYLVWPLLLLVLLHRRVPRWLRVSALLALAVASAVAMTLLADGASVSRAYYGTDSHAFGLALGGALAIASRGWPSRELEWPRRARSALAWAGPVALAGLLAVAVLVPEGSPWWFAGGLPLVAVLSAAVVAALLVPRSRFAAGLDAAPLRWIGRRSYGIYLWHWPLYVLLTAAQPGFLDSLATQWVLGGFVTALTLLVAAASYRFVEQPIRRDGFRATARRWFGGLPVRRLVAGAAGLAVVAGSILTGSLAVAADPGETELEALLREQEEAIDPIPLPGSEPIAPPLPSAPAAPVEFTGADVVAVGDSTLIAASAELTKRFPGIRIDGKVSRRMSEAATILTRLRDKGKLRPVVLVWLGANGPITWDELERVRLITRMDSLLLLATTQTPRPWTPGVNQTIARFVAQHPEVGLVDWHRAIHPHLDILNRDRVHFGPTGARIFADTLAKALTKASLLEQPGDDPPPYSL